MQKQTNPLADILERQTAKPSRKLSFDAQCAWFISLRLGVAPIVVAKASGLSLPTVCYLRMAGEFRSGQMRYPKVAIEYETLGHEAFVHKYLTPRIREELEHALVAERIRTRDPDINAKGYNPRANRCVHHRIVLKATPELDEVIVCIELHPGLSGYFWRHLSPYGLPEIPAHEAAYHKSAELHGDPSRGPETGPDAKGFARSDLCYRHVLETWGRREPKQKSPK